MTHDDVMLNARTGLPGPMVMFTCVQLNICKCMDAWLEPVRIVAACQQLRSSLELGKPRPAHVGQKPRKWALSSLVAPRALLECN